MKPLLLLLTCAAAAFAQPFGVGIKAGVPVTDFTNAVDSGPFNFTSHTQPYIGPTM